MALIIKLVMAAMFAMVAVVLLLLGQNLIKKGAEADMKMAKFIGLILGALGAMMGVTGLLQFFITP